MNSKLAVFTLVLFASPVAADVEQSDLTKDSVPVEEQRLTRLSDAEMSLNFGVLTDRLFAGLSDPRDTAAMRLLGRDLWVSVRDRLQSSPALEWDDRDLYWARLTLKSRLRPTASTAGLTAFETASRGFEDVQFPESEAIRVLVTGFDPFHLDEHLDQSNPSGLAALALDGRLLQTARGPARVEAVVFPVRFADFDQGMVEDFFEPMLRDQRPDLVVTISMGRDGFDLERFPGRRRSSAVTDNLDVLTGAEPSRPLVPELKGQPLAGPEFLEFSLPAAAMVAVEGVFPVRDNRRVRTLSAGEFEAPSLQALDGETAVAGSGGGYLSNEISYRSLLVNERLFGSEDRVPMGHLHTPRVQGFDVDLERKILAQIERILVAAIEV